MDTATLREFTNDLPREPGIYQFIGESRVLYIGKAVDLRSRVKSYVDPRSHRINQMVKEAIDIDIAVTDTETQALLLEANLIKRHQPRYNVRLTDDKSYPLVQLTDHEFPRIEVTRDPDQAATVWGPFTDKGRVDLVVKALRETFGTRGCSDHKFQNRDRPCLDYDIGLCTAPCTDEISNEGYERDTQKVKQFLDGATGKLADQLKDSMEKAAKDNEFERAAHLRDRLNAVRAFHGGSGGTVRTATDELTRDILGAVIGGETAVVARLRSEGGKLVDRERHQLDVPANTTTSAVLSAFIPQFYAEREFPDVIVLSDHPEDTELEDWLHSEGVQVTVPGSGREARLVDLALKNAQLPSQTNPNKVLAETLGLTRATRIEGFDISHSGGKSTVGSNVLFVGDSPSKNGYRRKKLTEQNDDVGAMRELIQWRAQRAIEGRDKRDDPDLLVIDGGQQQLAVAMDTLKNLGWEVPVVALAKSEEIVYTPGRQYNWGSDEEQLHLLQRIRDEAHRFARQYHQLVRDNVTSIIDDIPGVGPSIRTRLFRRFGSVDGIRSATTEELREIEGVGKSTAEAIQSHL